MRSVLTAAVFSLSMAVTPPQLVTIDVLTVSG